MHNVFKNRMIIKIPFMLLFFACTVAAEDLYVDYFPGTCSSCSSGSDDDYNPRSRNCGNGNNRVFPNIQAALDAMIGGDDIFLRGGTYQRNRLTGGDNNSISLPEEKNGSADNWSSIQSYPGEWAILDGENNCTQYSERPKGLISSGTSGVRKTHYWHFERFEIKNGKSADHDSAAGMTLGYGPFKIRFLYIHDNMANSGANNPSGIRSQNWEDTLVEYCFFENNGGDNYHNSCHLQLFGAYDSDTVANSGYYNTAGCRRNEYRYNLFAGGTVGIKHKGNQLFSERRNFSDTYKNYGDKIHHNIFLDLAEVAIRAKQDFAQIHNNIISNCGGGIKIGHERRIYKAVTYNNTIISSIDTNLETLPFERKTHLDYSYENNTYYGYDYNNIIEDGGSTWSGGPFAIGYSTSDALPDLICYRNQSNYFYRCRNNDVISITGDGSRNYYSAQAFNNAFPPNYVYANDSQSSNPLYIGTSGADRFKTSGSHLIVSGIDIANGGVGGSHPYLAGVSLPSYIGAVDPQNSGWVDVVIKFDNIANLMNGNGGGEGGDGNNITCAAPTNLRIVEKTKRNSSELDVEGGRCFLRRENFRPLATHRQVETPGFDKSIGNGKFHVYFYY